jgi:integrase/recombinase XerC
VLEKAEPPGWRVYRTYWRRISEKWAGKRLDEVTASDINGFITEMKKTTVVRSRKIYRNGHCAHMHAVSAFRSLYRHAEDDRLFTVETNPARKVEKPARAPSTRQAIPDVQLAQINEVVATGGDDPELDSLLLRLHVETACRRGGALALRACDLDPEQGLILLREKRNTERWQPVSATLMRHLLAHAAERGAAADPTGPLFRHRNGKPMSESRYKTLWKRVGKRLPWVATRGVTTHWLRHTTITWGERNFGEAVAGAYAGHAPKGGSEATTTSIYTKATLGEVAAAVAALTGEPHPMADMVDAAFTEAIAASVAAGLTAETAAAPA